VPFISPAELSAAVGAIEGHEGKALDCEGARLAGAIYALRTFFGAEWLDLRIANPRGEDRDFMRPPGDGAFEGYKAGDRIIALAEYLLNLQEVEGFQCCLDETRTGRLDSSFAKLAAAAMLQRRNIPFRFVVPSGKLGEDYDAEAIIGAAVVPIEMKAKVEGGSPTAAGIRSSLKKARRQLPKDAPNLVFLQVPEGWTHTGDGRAAIVQAIIKEFHDSRTLGLVVVHWERWFHPADAPTMAERGNRSLVAGSGRARTELAALQTALLRDPGPEVLWLNLQDLLCQQRPFRQ
jgi:hypothetical protein